MTYKELFDDAFSSLQGQKGRMSDDEFASSVREKAKNESMSGLRKTVRRKTKRIAIIAFAAALVLAVCGFALLNVVFFTDLSDDGDYWLTIYAQARSDAPETIEHYYEPTVPVGYQYDENQGDHGRFVYGSMYTVVYADENKRPSLSFSQRTVESFHFMYRRDDHISSPERKLKKDPENNTLEIYDDKTEYIELFWTDGSYIYMLAGHRSLIDLINRNDLHEVFPEVHDEESYFLEDKRNE